MAKTHSLMRKATLEDITQIIKLGLHVFTRTFGHSVPPDQLQAYLDEFYTTTAVTKDIEDPRKDMIVATDQNDTILGFALLTRGTSDPCLTHLEKIIELQRLYVHTDHHGKGLGKALALKTEEMAREQGYANIWLGVWEENLKAEKIYERLGYQTVGSHPFSLGNVVQTDKIMVKKL
ncbi:hypothetical protein MMC10_006914 [Thelotrema lepadinum]|nr:hypothetical protein [Thelotrema lepadinum]